MTDKDSTDAPRNEQEAIGEPAGDLLVGDGAEVQREPAPEPAKAKAEETPSLVDEQSNEAARAARAERLRARLLAF